jgi:hypothetical protein
VSAVPSIAMVRSVSSRTDSSYVFDLSVRSYTGSSRHHKSKRENDPGRFFAPGSFREERFFIPFA